MIHLVQGTIGIAWTYSESNHSSVNQCVVQNIEGIRKIMQELLKK